MEIRTLRYFLTVVQEESITRAANVLHITQPTLSRQLTQMEDEMGVKLFDRGTRRITLTNEGLLLRRRAEEILELVDKTEKEMADQGETVEGTVSIGCGDLADVPLILPRRLDVRSQLASWFGQWFDDLNVLFTSNLPAASSVMASRQLAYSINIRGSLSFYDERKVVCRPLRPRLTATSVLAWRRKQPFGVAAAKFIEHAGAALRQTADISE